jgi:ATP-binding cassette subfamily C (CFTR/MRP) protein 1
MAKDGKPTGTSTKSTNGSVLPAMTKAYGGPFWFAGFIYLIINGLSFASPMLLNQLITAVAMGLPVMWQAWLMVAGFFLITFSTAILNGVYYKATYLVGFRIRTGLVSAIYRKALRISSAAKKDTTVGEVVNLMSVDAQKFFELIAYLHILWSGPLVIVVATYLIWQQLGYGTIAGITVMVLVTPLSGIIATRLRTLQVQQMKLKDERVKLMNEILNGMKVLKLYAWEASFEKLIQSWREKELDIIKKTAVLNAGTYFVWTLAPFFVQLSSYITFVLLGGRLDANKAFVSAALFNILRGPMAMGEL